MLRSLCFLALVVANGATAGSSENTPALATEAVPPRLVFGGPVSDSVLWDEQHLWLVSRGGLYEIDACQEAPRRVELERSAPARGRRKVRDVEDELVLASLDDADWDDAVLEDFRDDEGLPSEASLRHRGPPPSAGPPRVLAVVRKGPRLDVVTTEGTWACHPDDAVCRPAASGVSGTARRQGQPLRAETIQAPEGAAAPPRAQPQSRGDLRRWETPWGVWFVNDEGVWFEARETTKIVCASFRDHEGGLPYLRGVPPATAEPMWLPRVSLLGARDLRRAGGSTRAETAVILLLTFSPGRRVLSHGAHDSNLGFPDWP